MASLRQISSFAAVSLLVLGTVLPAYAQSCADTEYEAKRIIFKSENLPIEKSGFFAYVIAPGSTPPLKYATEAWSGTGSSYNAACGCFTSATNIVWAGSWAFSRTDFTDNSTKSLAYDGTSCGGSNPQHQVLTGLKANLVSSPGALTSPGTTTAPTATTLTFDYPDHNPGPSSCFAGNNFEFTHVTDTLSDEFTADDAKQRGENNVTVVENSANLQYWNNFPSADTVISQLASGELTRISPLKAPAERLSFQAQFCVPCLGQGKFLLTFYYKKWNIGTPEPEKYETRTEEVEFKDPPFVYPQSDFKKYHFELKQGEQCKLVKITARKAEDCAKREVGASTGRDNSVDQFFFLGKRSDGLGAGALAVTATAVSSALYAPDALQLLAADNPEVEVIKQGDVIRQVRAPEALVDVVTLNASSYEIRFYLPSQIGSLTGGVYGVSGSPFVTYLVENPDGVGSANNRVRFTESRGSLQKATLYTYDSGTGTMAMSSGNGLRSEEFVRTVSGSTATETRTIKDAGGTPVSVVREVKQIYTFGENVVQHVVDPDGANLVTSYTYYQDYANDGKAFGQVKQVVEPSGRWTRYTYDAQGRAATTTTQFLDSAVGSADSANRVTSITYDTIADQDTDGTPEQLITTVQSVLGLETGRSHEVIYSHLGAAFGATVETRLEIQSTVAGAAWDAGTNLVTKRQTINSGIWFGKPVSELRPDGTLTTHAYASDAAHLTTTTLTGQADGSGTSVLAGTRTVLVQTLPGQMVSQDVHDFPSNTLLTSDVVSETDFLGRPTRIDHLDGTHELRSYACCGLDMVTDRQGITTHYNYNALGQVDGETRAGLVQSHTLDPNGRLLANTRIGSDNSEITTESHHYDLAGRLTWSKDALNRKTSFSEMIDGSGHTVRTTTTPDGGSIISTYAKDGSLLETSGSAASHHMTYEYGADAAGSFTKEIHVGGNGETSEWVKTYADLAGRTYKRVFADGAAEYSYYNPAGQLVKQVDADGVTTLFAYNGKGEQEVTAIDIDGGGTIDFAGTDRITRTQSIVGSRDSYAVQRTTTTVWETDSPDTPTTVSVTESTFDGLHSWQTVRGLTTAVVTALDGAGGRTVTITAPDGTTTTQTFSNDRLASQVNSHASLGNLSSLSYAYDPHGRLMSSTDARNGTTTYSYFDDDQIHTVTTPDPDTSRSGDGYDAQITTYAYDTAGRASQVTQPDGGVVNTTYWPTGQAKRTWGTRTYPVEYSYDSQGRVKTLTTWQDFSGNGGSAVTTWNYTSDRGFLQNKRYTDNSGPSYTYKPSGRLLTRSWARGVTTTYGYNAAGDIAGMAYSDATLDVTIGYDRTGRPQTRTDAAGTCAWTYDVSGQLKDEVYSAGLLSSAAVHRTFDTLSRLASVSAPSAYSVTYSYDAASRLDTITAGTNTAAYAYVPNSPLINTVTVKQSGNTRLTTTRSYDFLNRLGSISSQPSALGSQLSYTYVYNAANQRTQAKREDDSHWDYTYDALGQVKSAAKKLAGGDPLLGRDYTYTYDDIGNRKTSTVGGVPAPRDWDYTPNLVNQYSQRTVPGSIDVTGTAVTDANVSVNGQAASRQGENWYSTAIVANDSAGVWKVLAVAGVRPGAGPGGVDAVATGVRKAWVPKTPEQFSYDADGNLTADGRWSYTWDGENRLIAMETRADIVPPLGHFPLSERRKLEFAYDLQGRRISKKVSNWTGSGWQLASSTLFLYDGWNLIEELNAMSANAVIRTYTWGTDLSGSLQGAGGVGGLLFADLHQPQVTSHSACYDGNGNIIAYVDLATGLTSATYEYSAFGETLIADGVAREALPFRISSKYADSESDLLYYGQRYYSPSTGRWLSKDPLEEDGGRNLYGFVNNSPVNQIDADGLSAYSAIMGSLYEATYNSDPLADRLFDHYVEGSGTNFHLSKQDMIMVRAKKVSIRNLHRDIPPNKSFDEYLQELSAKGTGSCSCVDVRNLRVEGGALNNGTLGGFTIVYNGKLCKPFEGYWKFTGTIAFYDYWNFESHEGKKTQRSAHGESDVTFVRNHISGKPFAIYSVNVDATETSSSGETIWDGMGSGDDAITSNREHAGDLRDF